MSTQINVRTLGRFAGTALASGSARVIALFERSAYVETPGGLACLGAIGPGPLNAQCDALPAELAVGDEVRADCSGAVPWTPRPAPVWDAATVARSIERLRAQCGGRVPAEGFGFLLEGLPDPPLAVAALARWIASPVGTPDAAAGLIGLGPGLTPAGDDLIGGALGALHAAGRGDVAVPLGRWALALAASATNRISRAHLACAAQGECGDAVNEAIVALLSGHLPDLARIDSIGHTSGWDALAGVALALGVSAES